MEHPKRFLLSSAFNTDKNGLKTLRDLPAKHFDDISTVMAQFGEKLVIDVITRLNKGERIKLGSKVISVQGVKENVK